VSRHVGRLLAIPRPVAPGLWLATVVITFLAIWFQWIPPIGFARSGGPGAVPEQLLVRRHHRARLAGCPCGYRSPLLECWHDYMHGPRQGRRERASSCGTALRTRSSPGVTGRRPAVSVLLGTVIVEFIFLQRVSAA